MNATQKLPPRLGLVLAAVGLLATWWLFSHRPAVPGAPAAEILRRNLVQNDGRWYRSGETNLFTGWMVDTYPNGARLSRSQIFKGLLNGLSETWHTNGQMQVREYFKDGVSDGFREKWHENGTKLSQATIVAGKIIGTFQSWHDNGRLAEQIEMKSGQAEGTGWAYYASGFLKAETTVHEGQVLGRKMWKDGENQETSAPKANKGTGP